MSNSLSDTQFERERLQKILEDKVGELELLHRKLESGEELQQHLMLARREIEI